MAESSLSLTYDDLLSEVGQYLGYGRDASSWSTRATAAVASVVKAGLRNFYYPVPGPTFPAGYEWSFLNPTATFTLLSGKRDTPLPDDFGNLMQPPVYVSQPVLGNGRMRIVGEGEIMHRPTSSGLPQLCCVKPRKGTGLDVGQRWDLMVYPTPDADYDVYLTYSILPDALSESTPFNYGGMVHAETVRESCLAVAEKDLDDTAGVHAAAFKERLMASVAYDQRKRAQLIGDTNRRRTRFSPDMTVTYNGVEY